MNKPNRKFTPKPGGAERNERPRRPRTNDGSRAAGFSDKRYSPILDPDDNKEWQQRDEAGRRYRPSDDNRTERPPRADGPRTGGPRRDDRRTDGPRTGTPRTYGPRANDTRADGTRGDGPRGDGPRGNNRNSDFRREGGSEERNGNRFQERTNNRPAPRSGNKYGDSSFGEERSSRGGQSSSGPRRNEEGGFSRPGSYRPSGDDRPWGNKPRPRTQDDDSPRFGPRGDGPRRDAPRGDGHRGDGPRPERNSGRRGEARHDDSRGGNARGNSRFDGPRSNTPRGENRFNSPRTGNTSRGKSSFDDDRRSRGVDKEGAGFDRSERTPFGKKDFSAPKSISTSTPPTYDFSKIRSREPKIAHTEATIRLNKYIADAGICSRRDADTLIAEGQVKVNDQVVTQMGFKVSPSDTVTLNGKKIRPEKLVYVLLNKPKDFITTTDDPQERKTVMELVANAAEQRIYPVGRLDRNTTGLLLLTNDGELAEKLSHPSHKVKKVYQVLLDKPLIEQDFETIQQGVVLEDGPAPVDELGYVTPDQTVIGVEIHIGRNRIVRRIFESLGYEVLGLDRVVYAGLTKKDLPRGNWRYLEQKEVIRLKHFS